MQDWLTEAFRHPAGWILSGLGLGVIATHLHLRRRGAAETKGAETTTTQLRKAQDELTRLLGRYQLLESSHQSLQSDLSQERSVLMSLHAELARERSLRVNLELALETVRRERVLAPPPAASPATPAKVEAPVATPPAEEPPFGGAAATRALQELLQPINSELRAVRRELAERREPPSAATGAAIPSPGTGSRASDPRNTIADAAGPARVGGGNRSQATTPRQPSKAERELDNFFRRIQVDPSAAQSAAPGSDEPQAQDQE